MGSNKNDAYSRLITLTIILCVSDIHQLIHSIFFLPPPLLLNQMAFYRFLANKYSLFDFALNLVSAYCQTSDFQHKHWRCWCWAIYFQFELFFYCCFSIHLLLLMSFPYILMCEAVACQRYLHLHLVCQWEGERKKKNQHKHNQSKHSDYSSGTAKYEKYNRMIKITAKTPEWKSVIVCAYTNLDDGTIIFVSPQALSCIIQQHIKSKGH